MLKLSIDNREIILNDSEIERLKSLDIISKGQGYHHMIVDHQSHNISVIDYDKEEKQYTLSIDGKICRVKVQDKYDILLNEMGIGAGVAKKINQIKAPMPGLIFEIAVKEGDSIKKGDKVLILEAMKMENMIKAVGDGVIKKIHIEKGQAVEKGQILIELA